MQSSKNVWGGGKAPQAGANAGWRLVDGCLKCGVFFGRCITILKFSADEKSPDGATRGKPRRRGQAHELRLVAKLLGERRKIWGVF